MKFLIAGFGSIGRRHLSNLLALGEKDILVYHTGHSTLPEAQLAGFQVETDLGAALAQRPDAVIVANPTALHLAVAIPAAEAGCHILMEKPVSDSLEGTGELVTALRRGGGRLLVGFQFRFHPGLRKAAELLREGAIGRPVFARAHWGEYLPNWHPWEDYRQSYAARPELGGGVVRTLTHPFDYLRWLLGEAEVASAQVGTLGDLGIPVEDTAEVGLRFAGGTLGSLHLNYVQQPACHTLEIIGTQGTLRWDNADGGLHCFRVSTAAWEHYPVPDGFERNSLFLDEMRHFIDVTGGRAEPVCSLDDGLRVQQLALDASKYYSGRT
ncbi:MAG: Gfo/Idh/MocA family oxidoreductase [Chloroflexi bacterium]|nr:Gfo/Idh/MocA family oxidoreductase [Chloroflexota bacterium]